MTQHQKSGPDVEAMKRRVVARLAAFGPLEPAEIEHLASLGGEVRMIARGQVILSDNQRAGQLELLLDGWAASTVQLANGSRQIVTINLPGDLLGLPGLGVRRPIDALVALTPAVVCAIRGESIWEMFKGWPGLAARLFLVTQEERAMAMERLALVGKAPAIARLAATFLRLGERLERLDCGTSDSYDLPITQKDLADLVGVTPVHLNGVLSELKRGALVTLEQRHLRILDEPALRDIAQIDPWQFLPPPWPLGGT